ncbi:MAG: hypothetical protein ACTSQH_00135 [Candidatus Hodarchaeales archaeon]
MKIYLVTYIDHDTIEGLVRKREDFGKWLIKHNERRVEEGEDPEWDGEFEVKEVGLLK